MKINILGTEYTIEYRSFREDKKLDTRDGYTSSFLKLIVIENDFEGRTEFIEEYQKKILRHEIVHAFLNESGLDCNSLKANSWAENEEMVDWFAIQSPKIFKIYKELDIL